MSSARRRRRTRYWLMGLLTGTMVAAGGCGGGGADLSGDWKFAFMVEGEPLIAETSLSQGDEGEINGTGEFISPGGSRGVNVQGTLSEEGQAATLDIGDDVRLQGDLSENAERLRGDFVAEGVDASGSFAGAKDSDEEAPEAGSGEQREQVNAAVSEYIQSFTHEGFDKDEYLSSIGNTTVTPVFWSSPSGSSVRSSGVEFLRETQSEQPDFQISDTYETKDFNFEEEERSRVEGIVQYSTAYDYGEQGGTGTVDRANVLQLVRWGGDWKVLWASSSIADPWENLEGTWGASVNDVEELDLAASSLTLGSDSPEFTLTLDSFYIRDEEPTVLEVEGTTEGLFEGGEEGQVSGYMPTDGDEAGELNVELYPDGDPVQFRLAQVVAEGGDMEGEAATSSYGPFVGFEAKRQ